MDIEEAIKIAKTPKLQICPVCEEELYAPMDKLSIALYDKCSVHLEDNSHQANNLLKIAETL